MDDGLTRLQRAFADAVFFDYAPIPSTIRDAAGRAHASRFSVYRNNVFAGLINTVGARYPVVKSLLWDEGFNRIAQLYVTAQPPRSPVLLEYGETFPQFLRSIGQSVSADYLADVAELKLRAPAPTMPPTRRLLPGMLSAALLRTRFRVCVSRCILQCSCSNRDFPWSASGKPIVTPTTTR